MMRRLHSTALAVAVAAAFVMLIASAPVSAKSVDNRYVAYGVGAWTCGEYNQAQPGKPRARRAMAHFVEGYLTAFNVIVDKTYDILGGRSSADAGQWLVTYCQGHPDQTLANALAIYSSQRYPDRQSVPPRKK